MRYRIIVAFVAAFAFMSAAWSDTPIYKWVDKDGHVHYSTVPRSDQAQALGFVNKATAPVTAPPPATASAAATDDAALTKEQATDSDACKAARKQFGTFLSADYLYTVDDKGQKQKLSKKDQESAIEQAKASVQQACGGGE